MVKAGDKVQGFTGANTTIGTLILKFNSRKEMKSFIDCLEWKYKINTCQR